MDSWVIYAANCSLVLKSGSWFVLGSCSAVGEAGGRRVAACGRAGGILTSPATQPCPRRGQFSKAQDESTRAGGLSLSAEISTPQCGGMSRKRSAFVSAETFSHFFGRAKCSAVHTNLPSAKLLYPASFAPTLPTPSFPSSSFSWAREILADVVARTT